MSELISKNAPSVLIGILVGVLLVWWVSPTNNGGVALLVTISVIVSALVNKAVKAMKKRKSNKQSQPANPKNRKLWLPGDD